MFPGTGPGGHAQPATRSLWACSHLFTKLWTLLFPPWAASHGSCCPGQPPSWPAPDPGEVALPAFVSLFVLFHHLSVRLCVSLLGDLMMCTRPPLKPPHTWGATHMWHLAFAPSAHPGHSSSCRPLVGRAQWGLCPRLFNILHFVLL